MQAKRGQVEALQSGTAALRVKVDALLNATEAPKDVVETVLGELKSMSGDMKPLSAVAIEFRNRWQKQKSQLLEKRKAEVEHHLRQASNAQLGRMEAEADDQMSAMNQDFDQRKQNAHDKIHRGHEQEFHRIVEDWQSEVRYADHVKSSMVDSAISESIAKIKAWARQEETRIMDIWEQELSDMIISVNALDETEIQAMEDSRVARCRLVESSVERQQQDLADFRNSMQDKGVDLSKKIIARAQPDPSKTPQPGASAKRLQRTRAVAKREVEVVSQLHTDTAVRYLDEAAALERARVSAYHNVMQELGPEFAEQLQEGLMRETEAAASKSGLGSNWTAGGATASGLPGTFSAARQVAGQAPGQSPMAITTFNDADATDEEKLQNEVAVLREKARSMMAAVGRGDWRKDILEVAEEAIDGLRKTEHALAAGPLEAGGGGKTLRNPRESLSTIEMHARNFSDGVLKEFTRMRNVKVALSCSRSKHVREAMQQYEMNSSDIEDAIMPAVSKLAHEVEVIREVINASKYGQEKMPIYIIAACWRRALLAAYPALKRLWEAADVPDTERKNFIRKIAMYIAVEPSIGPLFQAETSALEATLPAPDWAVAM